MGIELTAEITLLDVDLGLVHEADDLDVVGGTHELHALESTFGDKTRATAGLGAPCDLLALGVSDQRVLLWGCPQAEV